jgi:hypothetical protein
MLDFADDIQRIAARIPFHECARCVHKKMMEALADAGYGCEREVDAFYQGKIGIRKGRIDIVAYRDGQRIGIEIDNCSPRDKSIKKLLWLKLDYRFVILRRKLRPIDKIRGIDGIFYTSQPRGLGRV